MSEPEKKIFIDTPEYKGEDRRKTELVITHCDCHMKHTSKIGDHDVRLSKIENGTKKMEDRLEDRMDENHKEMWKDIKAKVPNRLFYIFISVYSVFFIGGIIAVYTGMNKINLNLTKNIHNVETRLTERISTITTDIEVMKVTMDNHITVGNRIERKIDKVDQKVEDHIKQTNGGFNHGKN